MAKTKSSQPKSGLNISEPTLLTKSHGSIANAFDNDKNLVVVGPAGTGKTFISLWLSLQHALTHRMDVKIIRSLVPTRPVGHLPGTLDEKMEPYRAVYQSVINKICERDDGFDILTKKGVLSFESTSFLRGETFDNTIIIVDEFQNLNQMELHTIATRVGQFSRIMFLGDLKQSDIPHESGFNFVLNTASKLPDLFEVIEIPSSEIVRSAFVKAWCEAVEG